MNENPGCVWCYDGGGADCDMFLMLKEAVYGPTAYRVPGTVVYHGDSGVEYCGFGCLAYGSGIWVYDICTIADVAQ